MPTSPSCRISTPPFSVAMSSRSLRRLSPTSPGIGTGGRRIVRPLRCAKGPYEVEKFFQTIGETATATDFSPRDYDAAGEKVFVRGHYGWTVRKTGKHAESDWVHIFTIKVGRSRPSTNSPIRRGSPRPSAGESSFFSMIPKTDARFGIILQRLNSFPMLLFCIESQ